jgi:2,5-furandicarboxylate decarboxylase 1
MVVREFLAAAERAGYVDRIEREVDPCLEAARLVAANEGRISYFRYVKGSQFPILAGQCADRRYFGLALGVPPDRLLFRLAEALAEPQPAPEWDATFGVAPCSEIEMPVVDLEAIPFLTHHPEDGGPYASAAVAFINDPHTGANASFHRLLRLDRQHVAARLVERRGTETAWRHSENGIPVAISIGLPLHVLLAASMAPPAGTDEMSIAHALAPTPMVTCGNGVRVPAESEFVLEGWITKELTDEGPFVDLTGTYDFIRQQPIIEIHRITHRRDAHYHALLPGGLEHKLLMGMPREPTIFAEVNKVARCLNVNVTPGGASWLHAVIQIEKTRPGDGKQVIAAAFRGHGSLKHVWVIDPDIDLFDPYQVEWAVATRFQADRDLVVLTDQPSSSLDPSARHVPGEKSRTAKMGLDATVHWDTPAGPRDMDAYRRV